jgi:hypothetical protein
MTKPEKNTQETRKEHARNQKKTPTSSQKTRQAARRNKTKKLLTQTKHQPKHQTKKDTKNPRPQNTSPTHHLATNLGYVATSL